jgi:hypothetical protein
MVGTLFILQVLRVSNWPESIGRLLRVAALFASRPSKATTKKVTDNLALRLAANTFRTLGYIKSNFGRLNPLRNAWTRV